MRAIARSVCLILIGLLCLISQPFLANAVPDRYLPDLAKDYVYWRTKIILCTNAGKKADADQARERMRRAESYLFNSTYTSSEATAAIQEADTHYTRNPIRGGC